MEKFSSADNGMISKSEKRKNKLIVIRNSFVEMLRRMYWCENKLALQLPKLAQMSESYELKSAILAHLAVTENQIIRLVHIFEVISEKPEGSKCNLMEKIVSDQKILRFEPGYSRDGAIISCTQQIMDYEIKHYGQLYRTAITLKEELSSEFLATAIKEEMNAHRTLAEISLSAIYFDAAS